MKGARAEISSWIASQPRWIREAARRITSQDALGDEDIEDLTDLCISDASADSEEGPEGAAAVAESPREAEPTRVALLSIGQVRNVNRLAPDQTLAFEPVGLTVIYGDNAAGKSGYVRVLKNVCRARHVADVLPNVLEPEGGTPSATVTYVVDDYEKEVKWDHGEPPLSSEVTDLETVTVFDADCASVYLGSKNEVIYRPLGLDVFPALAEACQRVERCIDVRLAALSAPDWVQELSGDHEVGKLVVDLKPTTSVDAFDALAGLSPEELGQLAKLRAWLGQLESLDAEDIVCGLRQSAVEIRNLRAVLRAAEQALTDDSMRDLRKLAETARSAAEAASLADTEAFKDTPLPGTGSSPWRDLWEAARQFSEQQAYERRSFPVTDEDAMCPLCQQALDEEARKRLRHFESHVRATVQEQARAKRTRYEERVAAIPVLELEQAGSSDAVSVLQENDSAAAKSVRTWLGEGAKRSARLPTIEDPALQPESPLPEAPISALNAVAVMLDDKATRIFSEGAASSREELEGEVAALGARKRLGELRNEGELENEFERLKSRQALTAAKKLTTTRPITDKNTELTNRYVTEELINAFARELDGIAARRITVELQPSGGERGVFYHQLHVRGARSRVRPMDVLSEGERSVSAIAAFLAEASIVATRSAIILDDPVSSMDHLHRERVAQRLAKETHKRQVIVFTHDLVFLFALTKAAEVEAVNCLHRQVRHGPSGTGTWEERAPLPGMTVSKRIRQLRARVDTARGLWNRQDLVAYDEYASVTYGYLREAWEAAVEEILFNQVVTRFKAAVETNKLRLVDVDQQDFKAIDAGMSKCSTWLIGHDQPRAVNAGLPGPDELQEDVALLDQFVKDIRSRRKGH